jgi:signal peptidase I
MKANSRFLALVFAALAPGMGQLYNGLTIPAIAVGAASLALVMAQKSTLLLWGRFPLFAELFGLQVIALVVAAVQAARASRGVRKRGFRGALVSYLVGYLALWGIVSGFGITKAVSIASGSMAPNIVSGDRIVVGRSAYQGRPAKPGEIAVFLFPKDARIHFVKRVIGIAGDRVAFKNKQLFLNGAYATVHGRALGVMDLPLDEKPDTLLEETVGGVTYPIALTSASTLTAESSEEQVPLDSY